MSIVTSDDPFCEAADILPAFPDELKELPRWVTWKLETRNEKPTKILYDPRTGNRADSTDPATWTDYVTACTNADKYNGIGIVIQSPYVAIDLDKCRDAETGAIEPWARILIKRINSYTELSPSGRGFHIWVRATLPPEGRRKSRIEMYDKDRYFTSTGNRVDWVSTNIETRDLTLIHKQMLAGQLEPCKPTTVRRSAPHPQSNITASSEEKYEALMAGRWQSLGYPSQSEADQALCNLLAYRLNGDALKIDQAFRTSKLFRSKWVQRTKYRENTIHKAVQSVRGK